MTYSGISLYQTDSTSITAVLDAELSALDPAAQPAGPGHVGKCPSDCQA